MAIGTVIDISKLDDGWVLAPERYDPRRRYAAHYGSRLSEIANILREQTSARKADAAQRFLVLNTGDANNGIIKTMKSPCLGPKIGSTKKRIRPGQVIISRLRPYLRQVAWVDAGLLEISGKKLEILCSTEFFVLDSADGASIAFLVPFLLSPSVQSVLAASQEGGHHPRFSERALKALPIPKSFLKRRAELSAQVERSVEQARRAFGEIEHSVRVAARLSDPRSQEVALAKTKSSVSSPQASDTIKRIEQGALFGL